MGCHQKIYMGPCIRIIRDKVEMIEKIFACVKCKHPSNNLFCGMCGGEIKQLELPVISEINVYDIVYDTQELSGLYSCISDEYIIHNTKTPYVLRLDENSDDGFYDLVSDPTQSHFQSLIDYLDAHKIKWEYKFGVISYWS